MACAKGDQVPLGMKGYCCDGCWRDALHQNHRLEARHEADSASLWVEAVMTLPGKTFPVLKQVYDRTADHKIRPLLIQAHDQDLEDRVNHKQVRRQS